MFHLLEIIAHQLTNTHFTKELVILQQSMCLRSSLHWKWWVIAVYLVFLHESVVSLHCGFFVYRLVFFFFLLLFVMLQSRPFLYCVSLSCFSPLFKAVAHLPSLLSQQSTAHSIFTPLFAMFVLRFSLPPPSDSCQWLWRRRCPCRQRRAPWKRSSAYANLWTPPPLPSLARSCCCCRVRWSSFRRKTTGTSGT